MSRPIRVLQVVGGMDAAGVETYLLHVARRVDRAAVAMDFVANEEREYRYEAELKGLGAHFHRADPNSLGRYVPAFNKILREHGPYDVVHTHVHYFGALPLFLARVHGVPVRIAQSHNARPPAPERLARRLYEGAMRRLLSSSATHLTAVTGLAAA